MPIQPLAKSPKRRQIMSLPLQLENKPDANLSKHSTQQ
jgi:hypothetical protein